VKNLARFYGRSEEFDFVRRDQASGLSSATMKLCRREELRIILPPRCLNLPTE
jgi:hypothetical protein